MTIEEVKQQLEAIFNTLDTVNVSGYSNLAKMQGSMAVLRTIIHSDITSGEVKTDK